MDMMTGFWNRKKLAAFICVAVLFVAAGVGAAAAVFARDDADAPVGTRLPTAAGRDGYTPRVLHDPLEGLGLKGKAVDPDELKRILNENGYDCEIRVAEIGQGSLAEMEAYARRQKEKYGHLN